MSEEKGTSVPMSVPSDIVVENFKHIDLRQNFTPVTPEERTVDIVSRLVREGRLDPVNGPDGNLYKIIDTE